MKNYSLLFLLIPFYQCFIISMESTPSWYNLPDTVIMPIIAISEILDKQSLCLVNKKLASLASKKNIDKLIQFPCILSRNYHLNLMVKEATNNNDNKMFLLIKNAPLCNHNDAVDIISYFIAPDDSSTLTDLSLYKNDHRDDHIRKLLPIIIKVYQADKNLYENYTNKFATSKEDTPLLVATKNCHVKMVELLITKKITIDTLTPDNLTPLFIAISLPKVNRDHKFKIITMLLKAGANPNIQNQTIFSTPLMLAAVTYNYAIAKLLLEYKASVNMQNESGNTALIIATNKNDYDMMQLLLNHKADSNICNAQKRTALHEAANNSNLEAGELLFKNGALLDVQDEHGDTPLMILVNKNNLSIKIHEKINWKKAGYSLNSFKMAQSLLKMGANPNIVDINGNTALLSAIFFDNIAMIDLLRQHGADPAIKNLKGDNAYSLSWDDEIKELLEKAKESKKSKDTKNCIIS